jgi:hypothetical protein
MQTVPLDLVRSRFRVSSGRIGVGRVGVGDVPINSFGTLTNCPYAVTTPSATSPGFCTPNAAGLILPPPPDPGTELVTWFENQITANASTYQIGPNSSQAWWVQSVANAAANWYVFNYPGDAGRPLPTLLDAATVLSNYLAPAVQWGNYYASANTTAIPWNRVPWGRLTTGMWQWLTTYGAALQWGAIGNQIATWFAATGVSNNVSPLPAAYVDWASQDFSTNQTSFLTVTDQYNVAAGTASPAVVHVPMNAIGWSTLGWTTILWQEVPWDTLALAIPPAGTSVTQYFLTRYQVARPPNQNAAFPPSGSPTPPASGSTAPSLAQNFCTQNGEVWDAASGTCLSASVTAAVNCAASGGSWDQTTNTCLPAIPPAAATNEPPAATFPAFSLTPQAQCAANGGTWSAAMGACLPAGGPSLTAASQCAAQGGYYNLTTGACTPVSTANAANACAKQGGTYNASNNTCQMPAPASSPSSWIQQNPGTAALIAAAVAFAAWEIL